MSGRYDEDLKSKALLMCKDHSQRAVSEALGIPRTTLRWWLQNLDNDLALDEKEFEFENGPGECDIDIDSLVQERLRKFERKRKRK